MLKMQKNKREKVMTLGIQTMGASQRLFKYKI